MGMETNAEYTAEDSEMLETFRQMGPLLAQERYARPDVARENKKHKPNGASPAEHGGDTMQLLKAMGQLLLRVDAEQQALKRQDSWICFMQTEPQALLPSLIQKAAEWRQQKNVKEDPTTDTQPLPLRCHLTQHLGETLLHRLHRLAECKETDQLKVVAIQHGLLTPDNTFPFQKWSHHTQGLRTTSQAPITLQRMIKYGEQLQDILRDPQVTIRFHSMKPMAEDKIIPWLWQISMRADDLQVLLTTLQGSTVWGLLGMSLKPHSLGQSRPAQHLQELLGKGQGKHSKKGRSKGHHTQK